MAENNSTLAVVQTVLLAGVVVATTMAACSNDRLERQFIEMRKATVSREQDAGGGGDASSAAVVAKLDDLVRAMRERPVSAAPTAGAPDRTPSPEATSSTSSSEPGKASPYTATGWGGRRAAITYVEGAVPNAPLRLQDKPRPQNDWNVDRWNACPQSMNYFVTSDGWAGIQSAYVIGRLIALNLDAPPQTEGALALSWDVSPDKLMYTYHLRRGVQFADGRPFSAADVKFSYDVMRDPAVKADHIRSEFEQVESLEAPDPYTVVVKYKIPYWKGVYTVGYTLRALNKAWYEETIPGYAKKLGIERFSIEPGKPGFGDVFNKIRIPCPGTGPYYIESDEDFTKDFLVMKQNPFAWHKQVHPDWYNFTQLKFLFIKDDQAADEAFRKQDFDVMTVDHDRWRGALKSDPTVTNIAEHYSYDHIGLDCSYIGWNCRKPPFDDARVRRAMTMLTNRQWILDEIEKGEGTLAVCPSKRSYPTYNADLKPVPFDVEGAKKLLADAGWKDSDGDGVLDKDGRRFEFELKYPQGRRFYTRVSGLVEDACRKAGIRMSSVGLEWATFANDLDSHKFDAVVLYGSWVDPWLDPHDYHSSEDVESGNNIVGWHNARVDELLEAMRVEFDEGKRNAMYHEFNQIFYDEQPKTLLVHGKVGVVRNKRFEGCKIRPTGMQIVDMWVKPENVRHR